MAGAIIIVIVLLLIPVLVLLSGKLFSETTPALIRMAAVVEMIHTATLVHDDVILLRLQRLRERHVRGRALVYDPHQLVVRDENPHLGELQFALISLIAPFRVEKRR